MSGPSNYQPKSAFGKWMHERLPVMELVQGQLMDFPTPKNLNYWWTFGGILAIMLVAQLITGIVLAAGGAGSNYLFIEHAPSALELVTGACAYVP